MEFSYKATTLNGQTVEGQMEGKDEETIVQHLHQLGYIPIRILSAEKKEAGLHWSSLRLRKVGIKELLIFTQELSTLVKENLHKEIQITLQRENETVVTSAVPRANPPEGQGALGIVMSNPLRHLSWG